MDKESIDTILQDIGLEFVRNTGSKPLPPPDKETLNEIMIDLGLESIYDDTILLPLETNRSSK